MECIVIKLKVLLLNHSGKGTEHECSWAGGWEECGKNVGSTLSF